VILSEKKLQNMQKNPQKKTMEDFFLEILKTKDHFHTTTGFQCSAK